jgi:hypothetical protein
MTNDVNLVAGLTYRITEALVADLARNGLTQPWLSKLIEGHVETHVRDVLTEIQHRLYQDVAANLADIARQLHPPTERPPRLGGYCVICGGKKYEHPTIDGHPYTEA